MMREDLEHGGGRGTDDDFDGDEDDDDEDSDGGGGGARRKGSQRSAVGFSRRTVGRVLHPHVADGLGTAFAGYGGGLGGQRDTQALQSLWGIDDHCGRDGVDDGDAAAADGGDGGGGGGADSFHRERLDAMRARTGLQFAANPRQFDRFTGLPKYGAELSDDDDDVDGDDGVGVYDGAMEVEAAASAPQGRPGAGLHSEYGNGPGVAERLPAPGASGLLKGPTGGAVKSALRPSAEAKNARSGDVIGALRAQMRQEHAARARGQLYDDGYDDDDGGGGDDGDDEQDGAQRPPHSGRLMGSRVHFGKPGAGAALAAAGMCLEVVEHEPDSESGSDDAVLRHR